MAQHSLVRVPISNSVVLCGRNGTEKLSAHRFQNTFLALRLVLYNAFKRLFHIPNHLETFTMEHLPPATTTAIIAQKFVVVHVHIVMALTQWG
jgi:hypothetical protein